MSRFHRDIAIIRNSIDSGIASLEAPFSMTPEGRSRSVNDVLLHHNNYRIACVMVLLYPDLDESTIAFIERAESGLHGGQIGLPGGKMEDGETEIYTAIRETKEEIGVHLEEHQVWTRLTEVFIPPSNFLVHPFLAILDKKPEFLINKSEVKRIIEIPLEGFFRDGIRQVKIFTNSKGSAVRAPYYDLNGVQIWGATAMIIHEFTSLLQKPIVK